MTHFPFSKPPLPKKATKERRTSNVRLYGEAKSELRHNVAQRAKEHCETCGAFAPEFGPAFDHQGKTVYPGQLSHKGHGIHRQDTMEDCLWECRQCHQAGKHNCGGHPCPRRPGRVLSISNAEVYWLGTKCLGCDGEKKARESYCPECYTKLQPQTRYDLENSTFKDWAEALARGEREILRAKTEGVAS